MSDNSYSSPEIEIVVFDTDDIMGNSGEFVPRGKTAANGLYYFYDENGKPIIEE